MVDDSWAPVSKASVPKKKTFPRWLIPVLVMGGLYMLYSLNSFTVPTGAMMNTIMPGDRIIVNRFYGSPERGDIVIFVFPGNRNEVKPAEKQYYVKRCVAVAGDTVEVRDTKAIVNGVEENLPATALIESTGGSADRREGIFPEGTDFSSNHWGPMRVPKRGDQLLLNDSTYLIWHILIAREGHQIAFEGNGIVIDGKPATSYTVERDYFFGLGDNRNNSLDSRYWGFAPIDNITASPMFVLWSNDREDGFRSDRIFKKVE